jgi:hypothetical protein
MGKQTPTNKFKNLTLYNYNITYLHPSIFLQKKNKRERENNILRNYYIYK